MAPKSRRQFGRGSHPAATFSHDVLQAIAAEQCVADPASGSSVLPGTKVYHDAEHRNSLLRLGDGGIALSVYQFSGTYLSLAMDIPGQMQGRLRPGYRLAIDIDGSASRPQTIFARLNAQTADDKIVLHEALVLSQGARRVDFDLETLPGQGVDAAWVDIIFSRPRMVDIRLQRVQMELGSA